MGKMKKSKQHVNRTESQNSDVNVRLSLGYHFIKENNCKKAIVEFGQAAKQGSVVAETMLGVCHYAEKDSGLAFESFSKAAIKDDFLAQILLGCCYYYGEGVIKNLNEADTWLNKASKGNSLVTQALLGGNYFKNKIIENSFDQIINLLIKSAEQQPGFLYSLLNNSYFLKVDVTTEVTKPVKIIKSEIKKTAQKKQLAIIPLKTENDIVKIINKMDDVEYIKKNILEFDKTVIKIKLEGKDFNSSMSGSFIIGLAKYQEAIYKMYLINKYGPGTKRKITPEEAHLIDIKVTIKKGSTDAIIELAYNLLKEAIATMPPEHVMPTILGLAAIIVGGICLNGIGSKIITGAFKKKKEEIKSKNNQSKDDLAKKQIEVHESILNNAMEAVKSMSDGILQSNPEHIYINDKEVSGKSIKTIADSLLTPPEKPEIIEEQSTVTGSYQIKRVTLDFDRDSASADIYDVDTKENIKGLIIQTKSIYDGSFKVLKTAQDKQAIKLQLIITMRNDKLFKAVLDKIL